MSNKNKSAQLGMPFGTACGRLRKLVLFKILKKHGENVCAQCSGVIESADDLSIEHIKPWENVSVDLFWDLENIAFSHLHCNVGARRSTIAIPALPGLSWCSTCKSYKLIDDFHKNVSHSGLQNSCKSCRREKRMNGDWSNG